MSPLRLQPARHVRLFEQAVDQIKELIMVGELQPGDKLPSETDLSRELDVSRSSIREALRALESQGIIEVRSGAGSYVTQQPFSFSSVREAVTWLSRRRDLLLPILQVRQALEVLAAGMAAANADADVHDELTRLVDEQALLFDPSTGPSVDILNEGDIQRLAELDVQFHQVIAAASGNPVADELIATIVASFSQSNKAIIYAGKGAQRTIADHRAIAAAICAADTPAAEQAMRAHLERVARELGEFQD
jgi:GntR family transcriptional regulator, transcriptional repressor for pyruvate dehydrogenase complex